MQREIKFRAWLEWEHGNMTFSKPTMDYDVVLSKNGYWCDVEGGWDIHGEYKSIPIMQFIGFNDIKGNPIYECDILKVGENLYCEIVYMDSNVEDYGDEIHSAFHAKIYGHNKTIPINSYFKNNCIVIGNIYENSELIKL